MTESYVVMQYNRHHLQKKYLHSVLPFELFVCVLCAWKIYVFEATDLKNLLPCYCVFVKSKINLFPSLSLSLLLGSSSRLEMINYFE